jgi:hypothetical protein
MTEASKNHQAMVFTKYVGQQGKYTLLAFYMS